MKPESPDETRGRQPSEATDPSRISMGGAEDCRTCPLRTRCISYGWMSPGGLWFENAVVLRPRRGCRGFVGRGDDIRGRFVGAGEPADRRH